jgi:hypothetical protein
VSKSDEAALALAEAFFRCVPKDKKKRISESEWTAALQKFHRDAFTIRKQFSLGISGRAVATYQFQKRLFAAGFDADTVRKVVFSLVLNAFAPRA